MTRRHRLGIASTIAAAGVAADQLTKQWAQSALADGRTIDVLPTLELDLSYNSGFSFSTGAGYGRPIGVFVMLVCGLLVTMIWRSQHTARAVLLSVVLAGALGNLADRLFRGNDGPLSGEVVDFIDVTWYAVFNVADSLVVCGGIAFVVWETRKHRNAGPGDNGSAESAAARGADTDGSLAGTAACDHASGDDERSVGTTTGAAAEASTRQADGR